MLVTGFIEARGIRKEISFPFSLEGPIFDPLGKYKKQEGARKFFPKEHRRYEPVIDNKTGEFSCYGRQKYILTSGQWLINRKDFGITWNKLLDKGGIIVGNIITIDWKIVAAMEL